MRPFTFYNISCGFMQEKIFIILQKVEQFGKLFSENNGKEVVDCMLIVSA